MNFFYIFLISLPLLFRLVPFVVPAPWLEPYAYCDAAVLNRIDGGEITSTWRNMGWWEGNPTFSEAGEALARKLLDFADSHNPKSVLDIAHGTGDSLLLHLSSPSPPVHLHGLTSQSHETIAAQTLLDSVPHRNTSVRLFTASASLRPGKDLDHPLNPMRLHLGKRSSSQQKEGESDEDNDEDDDYDEDEDNDVEKHRQSALDPSHNDQITQPPPYDLIYVLDAIYHFPPSITYFLSSLLPVLSPGGTVVYTDILPPPNLSPILGHLILPPMLSVPARNLLNRPKSLEEYSAILRRIGYVDVEIEDWTEGVFPGFTEFLSKRSFLWRVLGSTIKRAQGDGWRFVAVRATKPHGELESARGRRQGEPDVGSQ